MFDANANMLTDMAVSAMINLTFIILWAIVENEMPTANTITKEDVKLYVAALAQQHGVVYSKTGNDALAEIITRLADDVRSDGTEDLLVALKRANVINGPTMVDLLGKYLDQCPHV